MKLDKIIDSKIFSRIFTKGSIVEYMGGNGWYGRITVGKTYKLLENYNGSWIRFNQDNGCKNGYHPCYFRKVGQL